MEKIKNLSIRKTVVLYMAVSLLLCFFMSALIVRLAGEIQNRVWWNYVDEEEYFQIAEGEGAYYMAEVPRPNADIMTKTDHWISEFCDFLQTYSILILSVLGSCAAVFLFYRNKLEVPLEELNLASQKISENDLDFRIMYENKDEMGNLCREFERMREQLEKNNRQLWKNIEEEKLLRAAIAHDIRSPLSVLKGYQEMLMEYLPDGTINQEQVMEMLAESSKQVQRMDSFVENMRKMNSLDSRELLAEKITGEMIKADIEAELTILERESGKTCSVRLEESGKDFRGDRAVILEVTENLLSNALQYAKARVEIKISVTDTEMTVCVRDDGMGFKKEKEELTKPFYRQNIKDSLKHAGIGMYIARLYCEKHGGRLLVDNGEQGGAVITAVFHRVA